MSKRLFILNLGLGKALLSIQAMICEMYMKSFADVSMDMDIAFFYFVELQVSRNNPCNNYLSLLVVLALA